MTPQASIGFAGYAAVPGRLNDVSASCAAQWTFLGPAYVSARAAYSYMGGAVADLPTRDGSFGGRSVPWAMVALGLQR